MESNQQQIPNWLLCSCEETIYTKNKSGNTSFLKKTTKSISEVLYSEFYIEKTASLDKFLQNIDPRVKLFSFLFYLLLCGFANSIVTLLFLAFICFIYASISGIKKRKLFKHVWLIIPLILLVLSIPAMTNIFIDGTPILYIYRGKRLFLLPFDLYLSSQGLYSVIKTVLRVGVSISFGYLLIVTTKWSDLIKGLSTLKVPSLITAIFNMTYKYIYILSKISYESMEARYLRTIGNINNKQNRNFIAQRMSFLFIKAHYISDELFDAMQCRGYHGQSVSLRKLKIDSVDIVWIISNVLISLLIIFIGEVIF